MTTAQERKQQERQVRRRRIQRAARQVFSDRTYSKASIEQIAREASLSVGAIYLYFRSKEDLYVSLLEETLEHFDEELGRIRQTEARPDQRLFDAWGRFVSWADSDIESTRILRLMSQPGIRRQLSDEVATQVAAGLAKIREHLAAIIEDGMNANVYRRQSASDAVDLMWAMFLGVLEAKDTRANIEVPGVSYPDLDRHAFEAVDTSLRTPAHRLAEAA